MKERPILFSGAMVRAILRGRKTQTRRICKKPIWTDMEDVPNHCTRYGNVALPVKCPYGEPGDRLWVKETFAVNSQPAVYSYRADWVDGVKHVNKWKPSIFCTRKASRITLEIVAVRVERLQYITGQDAIAEGIHRFDLDGCEYFHWRKEAPTEEHFNSAVMAYRDLWRSINGPDSWDANPWVWVVEFKRL